MPRKSRAKKTRGALIPLDDMEYSAEALAMEQIAARKLRAARGRNSPTSSKMGGAMKVLERKFAPVQELTPANAKELTERQRTFLNMVLAGVDYGTAAARASGCDPRLDRMRWVQIGQRLSQHPVICYIVTQKEQEKRESVVHDPVKLRSFVLNQLHAIGNDSMAPTAARVRALELLGKTDHNPVFADRKEVKTQIIRDTAQINTDIADRIARLLGPESKAMLDVIDAKPLITKADLEPEDGKGQ